ncbi:hypothetical protein BKA70DRAFT_1232074 [Coprinopsis sp. MPI-PUGE-AT-0042]|nr:hypothetical protein BKA70DRAFT_1232074 [Coprinopsis sp. MPI-PUGE-AT-0042]
MVQSGHRYKIVTSRAALSLISILRTTRAANRSVPYSPRSPISWWLQPALGLSSSRGWYWIIQNAETGGFLAVANGKAGDNVDAIHRQDGAFSWNVFKDETDQSVWRIAAANSAFHLDLSNHGDSKPGTPVKVWGAWEGRNQCWRLEEVQG